MEKHFLTLSGGAPARDGALPEEGQWTHPDADGSDELVEDQQLLQLQQSHVSLFGPSVVAVMVDDHGDSNQLLTEEPSPFLLLLQVLSALKTGFLPAQFFSVLELNSQHRTNRFKDTHL